MLPEFELFQPTDLAQTLQILAQLGSRARIMAGGTDLMVAMKEKKLRPECLVDINRVRELRGIEVTPEGGVSIGATTTLHEIERSAAIRQVCPVLAEAVSTIGSLQVRNRGTLGGNLANASPAADAAPALLALDAEIELVLEAGKRRIPIDQFFVGLGKTMVGNGEILQRILVPVPQPGTTSCYLKFGPRRAMDIAVVGVSVSLTLDGDDSCRRARVALGAVAPIPMRARRAEAALMGKLDAACIDQAAREAKAEARPIDDVRASGAYRSHLVGILVKDALQKALTAHRAQSA